MIIGETAKHDMQENNDEFLRFGDVVIVKAFFHISKEMVNIMAADIKKIIVSNAFVFGINKEIDAVLFIGYETDNKIMVKSTQATTKLKTNKTT